MCTLAALRRGEMKGDHRCTYTENRLLSKTLLHPKGTQGQTRCQATLMDAINPKRWGMAPGRTTEPGVPCEPPVTLNPLEMNH